MGHPYHRRRREIAFHAYWDGSDALLEDDVALARGQSAALGQHPRRANRRMAGERQLARRREDTHLCNTVRARRRVDKRRLGQVHFERNRLHLGVREGAVLEIGKHS